MKPTLLLLLLTLTAGAQTNLHVLADVRPTHRTITTNWALRSTERPAEKIPVWNPGEPALPTVMTLEYRATGYHYSGSIMSNDWLRVRYKGDRDLLLESTEIGTTNKTEWR